MNKEEKISCDCPCHEAQGGPCPRDEFCCPGRIPASVPNDLFCTPFNCPERIPTPLFNSPNSKLQPGRLQELQECFEEINDTLRTLGNSRNPGDPNQRQLQLHFRALRGTLVKVAVDCNCHDQEFELLGIVEESGANFIQINHLGKKKLILFQKICSVLHADGNRDTFEHEQELLHIDTCVRREITLHFGQIVGRSPELINLFFGIPLHLFILPFLGSVLVVRTEGGELLKGTLCSVEEGQIRLQLCENEEMQQPEEPEDPCKQEKDGVRTINFNEICFISFCS